MFFALAFVYVQYVSPTGKIPTDPKAPNDSNDSLYEKMEPMQNRLNRLSGGTLSYPEKVQIRNQISRQFHDIAAIDVVRISYNLAGSNHYDYQKLENFLMALSSGPVQTHQILEARFTDNKFRQITLRKAN